jgi:pilus assembly protein CpaF
VNDPLRVALYQHDELADLDVAERRLALRDLALGTGDPAALDAIATLADEIDGFGILAGIMADDAVTDVLVNGADEVWVDRSGTLTLTDVRFEDDDALARFVQRLVGGAGVRLDRAQPIADARLPDGSRIHAVLPPVAPDGPLVSIRRFPSERWTLDDLVARSMLQPDEADTLRSYVRDRRTIVISGRTGTGKSTLLDALVDCVPASERVVTVEELPELRPGDEHRVSLIARPPNVEGAGAIGLDVLVRASLRMRPDRIVVGEVRGSEALIAIEAAGTGHEGSMLTVHARSARSVKERLITLALKASSAPSEGALRRQVDEVLDVVVHLERVGDHRRVADICTFD